MSVSPVSLLAGQNICVFYDGEIWSGKFLDKFLKPILNENSSNNLLPTFTKFSIVFTALEAAGK